MKPMRLDTWTGLSWTTCQIFCCPEKTTRYRKTGKTGKITDSQDFPGKGEDGSWNPLGAMDETAGISAGSQWPSVHLPLNWWHLQWPTALMQHHHANNHRDQWVVWSSSTEEIKSNCLSSKPWLQQDVSFASAGGVQTYWINVTASFFSAFRVMQQCTVSFGTFRRTVSAIYRAATLALSPASQTLWLLGIAAWNLEAVLLSLLLVAIDIDTPVTSITAREYVANIVQWCMYMNK